VTLAAAQAIIVCQFGLFLLFLGELREFVHDIVHLSSLMFLKGFLISSGFSRGGLFVRIDFYLS